MWQDRALCRRMPADWWDTADDGARFAMTLCNVACPVRTECSTQAHGVIRGGVPYLDSGHRAQVCGCGRPIPTVRVGDRCHTCEPSISVQMPAARSDGRQPPGAVDRHLPIIRTLIEQGWSYRAIGARIGAKGSSVRGVCLRNGIKSQLRQGRPRKVVAA